MLKNLVFIAYEIINEVFFVFTNLVYVVQQLVGRVCAIGCPSPKALTKSAVLFTGARRYDNRIVQAVDERKFAIHAQVLEHVPISVDRGVAACCVHKLLCCLRRQRYTLFLTLPKKSGTKFVSPRKIFWNLFVRFGEKAYLCIRKLRGHMSVHDVLCG